MAFLSGLALVSGCGGCDSCLGAPSAEDAAAVTMEPRPPPPLARPDVASDAARDDDAGREGAPEAAAEPTPYLRDGGGLPRPKAPMPLGAFVSCGVYDGPACEKACPNGACRQECDGVECVLSCAAGYCSQLCGPTGRCRMTCNGGHCVQVCSNRADCIKECAGGGCE